MQFTEDGNKPHTNRENRDKTEVNKKTKSVMFYIDYTLLVNHIYGFARKRSLINTMPD